MRGGQAPKVVKQLRDDLRNVLRRAYDQDALATPIHLIEQHVVVAGAPADITRDFAGAWGIYGGEKDFDRDPAKARLKRDDGAWVHFSVSARQDAAGKLDVIAFDVEVVIPRPTMWFTRIDLNQPGHDNDVRGMRCHLHPCHDDIQIPWSDERPVAALELLLGLRPLKDR